MFNVSLNQAFSMANALGVNIDKAAADAVDTFFSELKFSSDPKMGELFDYLSIAEGKFSDPISKLIQKDMVQHPHAVSDFSQKYERNCLLNKAAILDAQVKKYASEFSQCDDLSVRIAIDKCSEQVSTFSENINNVRNFNTYGGINIGPDTTSILGTLDEIVADGIKDCVLFTRSIAHRTAYPAKKLVYALWEQAGGLMDQYQFGTAVKFKPILGTRSLQMEGCIFRNAMQIGEEFLTNIRDPGNPNTGARGVMLFIAKAMYAARVLMRNTDNYFVNTIFNNGVTYQPNGQGSAMTVNYQIPSWNIVDWTSGGGANSIGTINTSTGAVTPSSADWRFNLMVMLTNSTWRNLSSEKIMPVMNPNTAALLIGNTAVQSVAGSPLYAVMGNGLTSEGARTPQTIFRSYISGFENLEFVVDTSKRLNQNSSAQWGAGTGAWGNSPVTTSYNIPDGYIGFFMPDTPSMELAATTNIQQKGYVNAGTGEWLTMIDNTYPGSQGGPLNPFIEIGFGKTMGLLVKQPTAIRILKAATVI